MLREDRHQQILAYINQKKSVQVNELSSHLRVSVATVRRDLTEMEEGGLIRRVHGGAVLAESLNEPPIINRKKQQSEAKQRIGAAAAKLVKDGDTIIITSGTTTEAMVPFLTTKNNLTIITNAINIAHYLTRFPDLAVIVLGGWLRHTEMSLLGHLTDHALQDLRADKVFHGIFGLDPEYGLTEMDFQEVQTDRNIIHSAREVVVLADHTKFHQIGAIRMAPIDVVSIVVTDAAAPEEQIKMLQAKNIQVIRA